MKRATTSTIRLAQARAELTRAYSEAAAALPRRSWARPAQTQPTKPNPTSPIPTPPPQNGPLSGQARQSQGIQIPWDSLSQGEPVRRGPGSERGQALGGRDRQGFGRGQEQEHRGQWQREGKPQGRGRPLAGQGQRQGQGLGRGGRDAAADVNRAWPDLTRYRPTPGVAGLPVSFNDRQRQERREEKAAPPARSWAVSVPTPGMEEDVSRGMKRRNKDRAKVNEWDTYEEELRASEAEAEAARRKKAQQKVKLIEVQDTSKNVYIPSTISVSNLARLLNVRLARLQDKMYTVGMEDTSYDHILTSDDASLLALEFGLNPVFDEDAAFDIYPEHPHPNPSSLPLRPPIVTIMGHVDHGKTTLLDTLRSASVAAGEAGGITQHIGAFSVPIKSSTDASSAVRTVTFLDTPGHAAFSAMRARGAGVTDIVVLVVAADDGVMPQTKEVIELTRRGANAEGEGGVQLVVAINKCDKPGVDTEKVKHALLAEGVQLEEFGGDVPAVEVSGLTGQGLDTLTETLSTLAEMAELRAEVDLRAHGRVLESRIDKGRGPVATVLVQRGSLKAGSSLVAGTAWARVRQMTDDKGRTVKIAKPGDAVTVAGWKDVPAAGDEVLQAEKEDDAKRAVTNRKRVQESRALAEDVEKINEKRKADKVLEEQEREPGEELAVEVLSGPEVKELKLVIKGDVSGSIEAVAGALCGIGNNLARVKIVAQSVGEVTESDIALAKAVEGMVVAFNVNAPAKIQQVAAQQDVRLLNENVIYKLMDQVKQRVIELLPVTYEQHVVGEATVQEIFTIALKGKATMNIAGCRITNGVIGKHAKVRVVREGVQVYDGSIETLKQQKKDMVEMRKGNECGMSFAKFQDLKPGDHIQTYEVIEKQGVL